MLWHRDHSTDEISPQASGVMVYFGTTPSIREPDVKNGPGPQAFLVERGSNVGTLGVHFHPIQQFQVFVRGKGRFGGHDARPWMAHYADRFTPYGPIDADERGVAFLTLRATADKGAFFMPESQPELAEGLKQVPRSPRRNDSYDLKRAGTETEIGTWTDVVREDDQLRVAVGRLGSKERLALAPIGGSGAYLVVMSGEIRQDGAHYAPGSVAWFESGETTEFFASANQSAAVALLQFPA